MDIYVISRGACSLRSLANFMMNVSETAYLKLGVIFGQNICPLAIGGNLLAILAKIYAPEFYFFIIIIIIIFYFFFFFFFFFGGGGSKCQKKSLPWEGDTPSQTLPRSVASRPAAVLSADYLRRHGNI